MLLLAGGLAHGACGGDDSRGVGPSRVEGVLQVGAYLEEILRVMQAESANSPFLDWSTLRSEVFAAAGGARNVPEAYFAIETALRSLNDFESHYRSANGMLVGPPEFDLGCTFRSNTPQIPDRIGYVNVRGCACDGFSADFYAEQVQRAIRVADRPDLAGWIVDLRENGGGNMWPMIAGVGPILGEGIVGWIVYNNREYEREYRNGAALSLDEPFARVASPYTLIRTSPRVAVLTSRNTNSAGEAMVVWFKGRPETRFFGEPTCGHHHLLSSFRLSDGASLTLKTANNADRLKRPYAGPIVPDEIYTDPQAAIDQAAAWLLGGHP